VPVGTKGRGGGEEDTVEVKGGGGGGAERRICFLAQRWSKTASNCGALGRFSFLRKGCTTL